MLLGQVRCIGLPPGPLPSHSQRGGEPSGCQLTTCTLHRGVAGQSCIEYITPDRGFRASSVQRQPFTSLWVCTPRERITSYLTRFNIFMNVRSSGIFHGGGLGGNSAKKLSATFPFPLFLLVFFLYEKWRIKDTECL